MSDAILLIGGTGLVGPWAVAALRRLAPGRRLVLLNRHGRAPEGVEAIAADRHDAGAVAAALDAARPATVIDMIAFTVDEARATAALLADRGVGRAVVVSSADVYAAFSRLNGLTSDPPEPGPLTEDSPLRTDTGAQGDAYDKLGVERAYAAALPHVAALRLPAVYGWPDRGRLGPWADLMRPEAPEVRLHPALARWRFARVLNRNAGEAVALAALRAPDGHHAWNVAEPVAPSESEWAARIAAGLGWTGRIVEDPDEDPPGFRAEQDIALSDARIRADLGYTEVHDPDEGLRDALRRHLAARP